MDAAGQTDFRRAEQEFTGKAISLWFTVIGMSCKLGQCHPW